MRFRISIAAQISCVCFISGRRIIFLGTSESFSFHPWEFIPENAHSRTPTISCAFVPDAPGQDFRQVWSRWDLTWWSCRALRARDLKPSSMEKWQSTYLRELCLHLVLKWQIKTSGDAWHLLSCFFFSGVPGLFIPVAVLFSSILNLLFCGPPASQGYMAAPGL